MKDELHAGDGPSPWLAYVVIPIVAALIGAAAIIFAARQEVLPSALAPPTETDTVTAPPVTLAPETVTVAGPTVTVTAPEPTGTSDVTTDDQGHRIVVEVQPQWSRTDVGPNLVRLLNGSAPMYVGWEVRKDNQVLEGRDCAVRVTMEGPEDFATIARSQCAQGAWLSDVSFRVRTAGTYRAVVVDEVSDASGSVEFTVEG